RLVASRDPRSLPDLGRSGAAAWASRFGPPRHPGVSVRQLGEPFAGLELTPPEPTDGELFFIHGGGLVYYDTAVFAPFLSELAAASGVRITAFDYPKAPETATGEIVSALRQGIGAALDRHPGRRITLAGDSVGGLLAVHFALADFAGRLSRLQLIYPVAAAPATYDGRYATGHFLDGAMMSWFRGFIDPIFKMDGGAPADLAPEMLRRLPPVTLHIAECDILAAEGHALAAAMRAAGIATEVVVHAGLPHDFCLHSGRIASAAAGTARIAESLRQSRDS
ncbi:MAG: alpha/beta hydrolase, partial [Hyphomicrobiales bacterium]